MPNTSYTYQRGEMFADPEFLAEYDVYAGAANYGIALRKDSPVRPQIDHQMQVYWSAVYPGCRMSDYLVCSASWSGRKFKVVGDQWPRLCRGSRRSRIRAGTLTNQARRGVGRSPPRQLRPMD
jgi:hypothetical protein